MTDETRDWSDAEVAEAVRENPLWYHTMELRPGIVTPGWFDVRSTVDHLPWPEVSGKRCLDIGTYDGFLAFELERRGAAEVVATDIAGHEGWDWPAATRAKGPEYLASVAGIKGRGFEVAHRALRSSVTKRVISIYDLSPETVGTFDVVVMGALLLHLRDPVRALEAVRSVCAGQFMSSEQVDPQLTLMHPRTPVTTLGHLGIVQWHVPNVVAHRTMIEAAGFTIERTVKPYELRYGPAHPPGLQGVRGAAQSLMRRLVGGGSGVPYSAVLARPAI